jgi:hypothetical protein
MESIGPLVDSVIPRLLAQSPMTPEKVNFAWRVAVGAAIDHVTRARLAGVTLLVDGDPHWLREVDRSRDLILGRLQRLLGADNVRGIKCIEGAKGREGS